MTFEIDNLACWRGGREVFRDLSFWCEAGDVVLLRGPNGAGKSTLLRVVSGLLPPSAGDVRLDGISLDDDRATLQEQIVYAGHQDAVKPALSVRQNLHLWAGIFNAGTSGIDALLARFDLARIADRPVAQCSAGQKRRLGLARLPLLNRRLWLLDEPTVSLDASATALVAGLIRDHARDGGIVIAATHIELGLAETTLLELKGELAGAADGDANRTREDAFLAGDWT